MSAMYGASPPPIQRLPPELLSEVFLCCSLSNKIPNFSSRCTTPWHLGWVCSFWRRVALSTPALWSSLYLDLNRHYIPVSIPWVTSTWLSRSGALPISLTLSRKSPLPSQLLEAIMPYSYRWRTLTLFISRSVVSSLSPVFQCLTTLEYLDIALNTDFVVSVNRILATIRITAAPNLTRFLLTGVRHTEELVLPWQQLTRLSLIRLSLRRCLSIIASTPSLLSCTIKTLYDEDDFTTLLSSSTTTNMITSNLRTLTLSWLSSEMMARLFSKLTLPELSELVLFDICNPWPRAEFTNLASRSRFQIRRLKLIYMYQKHHDQIALILEGMESLEELDMSFFTLEDDMELDKMGFIEPLTYRPSLLTTDKGGCEEKISLPLPPPSPLRILLPRLQVLTLHGMSIIPDRVLVDMIESRWKIQPNVDEVSRLRLVNFKDRKCWDVVEVQRLEEFCRQGLKVIGVVF